MNISRPEFENLVLEAVAEIPESFRRRLDNVAFTVESRPDSEHRRRFSLGPNDTLLGLYQGVPNTRRGIDYGNVLPDKITIFQEPLAQACPDLATLKREIRKTVLHEVGHYFGLSDAELRKLEKNK
jgi:predicted Zn-dependent protease with MMP-like domain